MVWRREVAEDATQEILVKAVTIAQRFREILSQSGFDTN